jgi:hypothetical protein
MKDSEWRKKIEDEINGLKDRVKKKKIRVSRDTTALPVGTGSGPAIPVLRPLSALPTAVVMPPTLLRVV